MATSRTASLSKAFGAGGLTACALGPAAANLGIASPMVGFGIFALGLALALIALLTGAIGLLQFRSEGGEGRVNAITGTLLGLVPLAIALGTAGSSGDVPRINDITTNTIDPPGFSAAATDDANAGRDLSYPGESFAEQQRAAYPDIETFRLSEPPDAAFTRCVTAAEELGWKLTYQDAAAGRFEAIDVTSVFRFVDDISVRVQREGAGSLVDIRSKSRDGKSDLGANAARIRAFGDEISD